jgi:hypothetical protein
MHQREIRPSVPAHEESLLVRQSPTIVSYEPMTSINKTYLATVLALTLVLPAASVALARLAFASPLGLWDLVGEWFLFWALGVRQLLAGLRQASKPEFTAREIFRLASRDGDPIVRELGFANLCMGLAAVVSLWMPAWRMCAAFASGSYFGLAGVMHAIKGSASVNERLALVSDLFIFGVMAAWFVHGVR